MSSTDIPTEIPTGNPVYTPSNAYYGSNKEEGDLFSWVMMALAVVCLLAAFVGALSSIGAIKLLTPSGGKRLVAFSSISGFVIVLTIYVLELAYKFRLGNSSPVILSETQSTIRVSLLVLFTALSIPSILILFPRRVVEVEDEAVNSLKSRFGREGLRRGASDLSRRMSSTEHYLGGIDRDVEETVRRRMRERGRGRPRADAMVEPAF